MSVDTRTTFNPTCKLESTEIKDPCLASFPGIDDLTPELWGIELKGMYGIILIECGFVGAYD